MIRVLLIDDHRIVREGIQQLLESDPHISVVGALDSGFGVLEAIDEYKPDLLLLDMELPGKSGPEIAREIIAAGKELKIVALSAYNDYGYVTNMLELGASGYINKEESFEMIVKAVLGVMRGEEGWFSRSSHALLINVQKFKLSPQEIAVLQHVANGKSIQEMAETLFLAESTIKTYLTRIYDKIGTKSMRETMRWGWEHGFHNT